MLIIDQLEEKHMRKLHHLLKTSDSESLYVVLCICSEKEFYFRNTDAVGESREHALVVVQLYVIVQCKLYNGWTILFQNFRGNLSKSFRINEIMTQI